MHESVHRWVARQLRDVQPGATVIEVGSLDVNGNVRDVLPADAAYTGVDIVAGPNVDRVLDPHTLDTEFDESSADVVLCLEVLEHDAAPWLTAEQIAYVAKPGAVVLVTARGNGFPEHHRPDRWRFMRDGLRGLLEDGGLTVKRITADPLVSGWFALCTVDPQE